MPPDISDLSQIAQVNDRLLPNWINAVKAELARLSDANAFTKQQLEDMKAKLTQAFQVTSTGGLSVAVSAGVFKNTNALVIPVKPSTVQLPDNATSFIFVTDTGSVTSATARPPIGLEIASVVTKNGKVVTITNFPLFESRSDRDNNILESIPSFIWQPVSSATKTQPFAIPGTGKYYTIPFESITGTGFNTAGEFKSAQDSALFKFQCQIRVDTVATESLPDMAAKLSLFLDEGEVDVPLQQGESARGDLTFNAENPKPLRMKSTQKATIRIYLTAGRRCRVREGSNVQVWKIPG